MVRTLVLIRIFFLITISNIHSQTLVTPVADSTDSHSTLRFTIGDYGVSFGNVPRNIGLRLNFSDSGIQKIIGLNFTLWRPGENYNSSISGLSIGLFPSARIIEGIALGLISVNAHKNLYGLNLGCGYLNSGNGIHGINIGGFFINGNKLGGINATLGYLKSSGIIQGLSLSSLLSADELRGIHASLFYTRINILQGISLSGYHKITGEQRGITLGILNMAESLRGIQIGVLNFAGNNPIPFKWLPLINFHY